MTLASQLPSGRADSSAVDDERARKAELGQFFTPDNIARFMAGLFPASDEPVNLLDAGAGTGALTKAFLRRVASGEFGKARVSAVAYEIDAAVQEELRSGLSVFSNVEVRAEDFIARAAEECARGEARYTHAILNPPYKKLSSQSPHKGVLRRIGVEAVNLYAAFASLALLSLRPGGYLCAILPRSFCNGPYYRPFRDLILKEAALVHIHVFDSRTEAFGSDDVLQENVIMLLARGMPQASVRVSRSTDSTFGDYSVKEVEFDDVVRVGDAERMFRVPTAEQCRIPALFSASLRDLGLQVSTGPVVDFRLRAHLRHTPGEGTVPLVYPTHFGATGFRWPYGNPKKPSAIADNSETRKWLYPSGTYTVVRRLSSKEERKRIIARVVGAEQIDGDWIGFENHLNVFHDDRAGLSRRIALGLMVYLNWSRIDAYFRSFNGHTQVNATDLRVLPYPDRDLLTAIGAWAEGADAMSQAVIDAYLAELA